MANRLVSPSFPSYSHRSNANLFVFSVADHVGRNFNQCITRWTNTLDPAIKKGKWTPQEDAILFSAVHACTDSSKINWKHVGERLGGRTGPQCRERWVNRANPKLLSMDGWEREASLSLITIGGND